MWLCVCLSLLPARSLTLTHQGSSPREKARVGVKDPIPPFIFISSSSTSFLSVFLYSSSPPSFLSFRFPPTPELRWQTSTAIFTLPWSPVGPAHITSTVTLRHKQKREGWRRAGSEVCLPLSTTSSDQQISYMMSPVFSFPSFSLSPSAGFSLNLFFPLPSTCFYLLFSAANCSNFVVCLSPFCVFFEPLSPSLNRVHIKRAIWSRTSTVARLRRTLRRRESCVC